MGRNTRECVRLYENWLSVLNGQPADEDYLVEEERLSKNRIHKSEIELLLAQFEKNMGNTEWERKYLLDAQISGDGLYAQRQAKERLEKL